MPGRRAGRSITPDTVRTCYASTPKQDARKLAEAPSLYLSHIIYICSDVGVSSLYFRATRLPLVTGRVGDRPTQKKHSCQLTHASQWEKKSASFLILSKLNQAETTLADMSTAIILSTVNASSPSKVPKSGRSDSQVDIELSADLTDYTDDDDAAAEGRGTTKRRR